MQQEAAGLLRDIARDPRATPEALQMMWDAGIELAAILRHPNCPPAILSAVAARALDSSQEPSADCLAALRHPMVPAAFLWRAVRSGMPELVAAAAACPDLPSELATEIMAMTWMRPSDLLGAARIEEAKRLAASGWNVSTSPA